MNVFYQVIKNTWAEYSVYRVSFILWRARWVLQRLVIYFLWWAVYSGKQQLFGYSESAMLTYIIVSNIIATFTLGTRTAEIGDMINRGDLSNFLIRPLDFFSYYLARDTADKLLNLVCAIIEIGIFIIIFRPPFIYQYNVLFIIIAIFATFIGALCFFLFSTLIGFIGFWSQDVWAPRFLSLIIMEFFTGSLFPLDILPAWLYKLSTSLPFYPLYIFLSKYI